MGEAGVLRLGPSSRHPAEPNLGPIKGKKKKIKIEPDMRMKTLISHQPDNT